ncbi:hypothetical protein V6N11_077520 [Hibiscus sabdariffa]|uniref:Uncharacterized protein n=1 Tax=Hibiscus sabdariffa TaxID=183260 RepID=A0ABR2TDP5_9ROSI
MNFPIQSACPTATCGTVRNSLSVPARVSGGEVGVPECQNSDTTCPLNNAVDDGSDDQTNRLDDTSEMTTSMEVVDDVLGNEEGVDLRPVEPNESSMAVDTTSEDLLWAGLVAVRLGR